MSRALRLAIGLGIVVAGATGCGGSDGTGTAQEPTGSAGRVSRSPRTGDLLEEPTVRELELDAGHGVVARVDVRAAVVDSVTVDIPERERVPPSYEPGIGWQYMSLLDERLFEVYWWTLECHERPSITLTSDGAILDTALDPGPLAPDCGAPTPETCAAGRFVRLSVTTNAPLTPDLITWAMSDSPLAVTCLD